MTTAKLTKSDREGKKYKVVVERGDRKKTIHFGAAGMSDYTKNKDDERKKRYIEERTGMTPLLPDIGVKTYYGTKKL